MTNKEKARQFLTPAYRQYRDNDTQEYVQALDYEETIELVTSLLDMSELLLSEDKNSLKALKALTNSL